MNKNTVLSVAALILVVSFIVFYSPKSPTPTAQEASGVSRTQSADVGEVAITVAPIDISLQSKQWTFNIGMNTHSVELQTPMQSAVLVDDQGKEYKPTAWSGPAEGHHMNGTLTFSAIAPTPKSISLKISISGETGRSLSWNL